MKYCYTEKIGADLESEGDVQGHDASTNGLINAFKKGLKEADYTP